MASQDDTQQAKQLLQDGMTFGMADKRLEECGLGVDARITAIQSAIRQINFRSRLNGVLIAAVGIGLLSIGLLTFFQLVQLFQIGFKLFGATAMVGLILIVYGIYCATRDKIVFQSKV